MRPRMAMNAAQHKIVNLLKTLLPFITKFYTRFYYLDMYICYISDCLMILKDYRKGRCIIRVIMWGLFCSSDVVDITKIIHDIFCWSVFLSVCLFNVWPKTTSSSSVAHRCQKVGHPCRRYCSPKKTGRKSSKCQEQGIEYLIVNRVQCKQTLYPCSFPLQNISRIWTSLFYCLHKYICSFHSSCPNSPLNPWMHC